MGAAGKLGQATDPPGPPLIAPVFPARERYLELPRWLGTGTTPVVEALAADGAGHGHPGHHQCFCHMSGLMQGFQSSPVSQSKPRDRFLFVTSVTPCALLPAPPSHLALGSTGSVLACFPSTAAAARLGPADEHNHHQEPCLQPGPAPCGANNVLSSGQEILWQPLGQARSPAAKQWFPSETEASLRTFFIFW